MMTSTREARGRLLLVVTATVLGALALSAAPALAAAPETPDVLLPFEVTAQTATFAGVLNPGKAGEAETYEKTKYDFLYKKSKTECKGGSVVPATLSESQGGGEESVAQPVAGLTKDSEYTVCLRVKGTGGEAVSTPITFKTAIPPEKPAGAKAADVNATTATLEGVLNNGAPGNPGTYEFHYRQSATECEGAGEQVVAGSSAGNTPEPVEAKLTGLLPGMPYTFCLYAKNEAGEEARAEHPVTFATPAVPPAIATGSELVTGVEATTVTLHASIDPGGAQTSYSFEYGTTSAYGQVVEGSLAADDELHSVQATITGLQPGRTYHYRVVASNSASPGGVEGPAKAFATPVGPSSAPETCENATLRAEQPFGLELPECRAYEMVSPVETNGQDATDSRVESGPRAAVSGDAITYASRGSFAGPMGGVQENQMLSRREPGEDRWSTQAITPLHEPEATESYPSYEATAFNPELTEGIANSNAPLTPEAPKTETHGGSREKDLYLADFGIAPLPELTLGYVGEAYDPMGISTGPEGEITHVVFGEYGRLSEWMDGRITLVGVANSGTEMSATVGSQTRSLSAGFNRDKDVWQAVSADGSRVVFTSPAAEEEGIPQVYVRVNTEQPQSAMSGEECTSSAGACTVEVSASQRATPDPNGPQPARYWGASANGAKLFFTSSAELTDDAYTGAADNAANLYECNLVVVAEVTKCDLRDLTGEATDATGEGAAVQGVVQISEDGSYVYFVAKGALAAGASEQQCRKEEKAEKNGEEPKQENLGCNLYVSHEGGAPKFIAELAYNDKSDWLFGNAFPGDEAGPTLNTAVVNPAGNLLAFMSERSLTDYDNTESRPNQCNGHAIATNGERETSSCREVFLYDAATGEPPVCASCNPTGERPVGASSLSQLGSRFATTQYRARALLADGTLFFNSSDALVPGASEERQNVYEYVDGHVSAISDVSGANASFFIDASASGNDVFFGTADALVTQDTGTNEVVYDARVDGGFPASAAPAVCNSGDTCKPAEASQPDLFGAPVSGTFSGPGNLAPVPAPTVAPKKKTPAQLRAEKLSKALKACRRDRSKTKRAACEKSARKRYGAKAKKASDAGRASR